MAETPDYSPSSQLENSGEATNEPSGGKSPDAGNVGPPSPGFRVLPPEGPRVARGVAAPSTVSAVNYAEFVGTAQDHPEPASNGVSVPDPTPDQHLAPYEEPEEVAAPVITGEPPAVAVAPPLPPRPPLGGPPSASSSGPGGRGGSGPPSDSIPDKDMELGLFEHLAELRARILSCVYVVFAMSIVTWNLGNQIQDFFAKPIESVLAGYRNKGGQFQMISTHPTGFFVIYCQISVIAAIILTMPWILYQIWRFLEPALTKRERRYTLFLVPFSVLLFVLGVALGYYISPMFYQYFLAFRPKNVAANWDYLDTIVLQFKLLLAFGISFQVPVITIFLNKAGLVSRNWLIEYWRHAIIVIFVVVAFITPTWDPLTMTICAVPPCILYGLSIWLIKWL